MTNAVCWKFVRNFLAKLWEIILQHDFFPATMFLWQNMYQLSCMFANNYVTKLLTNFRRNAFVVNFMLKKTAQYDNSG